MYDHDVMPRCMRAQEALESVFCELATLHAENARLRAVVAAADKLRAEASQNWPALYRPFALACDAYDEARAALGEVE